MIYIFIKKRIVIKIRSVCLFFLLNLITYSIASQTNVDRPTTQYIHIIKASDSLLIKTYKQLESSFYENEQDSVLSKTYANNYLIKAKKENDSIKIADGYYFLSRLYPNKLSIKYLDSLIHISKNVKHIKYPGVGYLNKGACFSAMKDYNKALKNYLIALEYANINNNTHHQIAIKHNIGLLKKALDATEESLAIFKENLEFIRTQDTINTYSRSYIVNLYSISDSYHKMDLADSATYYLNKGLIKSFKRKDKFLYTDFLLVSGVNNYLLKNYQKSLDTLYKVSRRIQEVDQYNSNESYCYIQIARVLKKLHQNDKAIHYLKKAESIITKDNYTSEKRAAFDLLIDHYKNMGDTQNQLKTMSRLIVLDSAYNVKNKNLKSTIAVKYDTALLINERDEIINELEGQKNRSSIGLAIFVGISIVLLVFLGNYYSKQRIYKKRFRELLKERQTAEPKRDVINVSVTKQLDITDEMAQEILEKLQLFEENLDYLKPGIKMSTVAKQLKTNTTYFSRVINVYKKKNFANYVNDLRIEYCIEKLKTDRKFRLYSIESIGQEVGFSSIQSFSRAFTKKTGLTASYFIKNIDK